MQSTRVIFIYCKLNVTIINYNKKNRIKLNLLLTEQQVPQPSNGAQALQNLII